MSDSKNVKWIDSIKSNPSLNEIQKEIYKISSNNIEAIIVFGGGHVLIQLRLFLQLYQVN